MINSAIDRTREQWSRASLVDILGLGICVGAFGLAVTGAKVIHGVPGHAIAFWLPVLVAARWVRPRPGAAAITAVSGGLLFSAYPRFGVGKELVGFVVVAAVLEAVAWVHSERPPAGLAIVAGVGCGLAKFASRWSLAALGLPAKWVLAELFSSTLLLHVLFGALGGLLGWLILKGITAVPGAGEVNGRDESRPST